MISGSAAFYLLKHKPDGEGVPHFLDMTWSPDLPEFRFMTAIPEKDQFATHYDVKIKAGKLSADFLLHDYLASEAFMGLCRSLDVPFFSVETDIALNRGKRPEKRYFFFLPTDRLSLLDEGQSDFVIDRDKYTGKLKTPAESGVKHTVYEKITRFVPKEGVKANLFLSFELKMLICSASLKQAFEAAGMVGLDFIPIDDSYQYDPWADFAA